MFKTFVKLTNNLGRLIIVLVLIFSVAAFCIAFPHKLVTAKNVALAYYCVYKGDKEYFKHEHVNAIRYYQRALQLYPGHANASYNLGNIYAVYEDYLGAVASYKQAIVYKPNFMNARIALGILLSEKFLEFDEAIAQYDYAIKRTPFSIPILYNEDDYVVFNKAVAYHNRGLAYKWKSFEYGITPIEVREDLQNAAESYKNAIKLQDDFYESYFNLALALHLLGNYPEAKKVYCKCINMRPFDYDVHYNLAILLREENNYLDAMIELEKAALIVDSDGDGYKTRYIYDVISETSKKLYAQENYQDLKEKLHNSPINGYIPTFVNGRIVASEELDMAIVNNMKKCDACKNFEIK